MNKFELSRKLLVCVTLFCCCKGIPIHGSLAAEKPESDVIECEAWIKDGFGGNLRATVDVGELMAGKRTNVLLTLLNSSGISIPIKSITTSCGCLSVRAKGDEVPPLGEFEMDLSFDVSLKAREPKQTQVFTVFITEHNTLMVELNYRVAGLVSFLGSGFSTRAVLGAQEHSFRIPILVTKPATLSALEVTADGSLGELNIAPITEGGLQFLECQAKFDGDLEESRSGEIKLTDPNVGSHGSTLCIVELQQPVVISPSVLRFSIKQSSGEKDEKGEFSATAIARVNESLLRFKRSSGRKPESSAVELAPEFSFSDAGGHFSTRVRRLAKGIYRLTIVWEPTEPEQQRSGSAVAEYPQTTNCTINTGRKVVKKEVKTRFVEW